MDKFTTILNWLIARAKEPSTWRGLVAILGVVGVSLSPEQAEAIGAAVIALIAAIEVFRKEKPATPPAADSKPPQL